MLEIREVQELQSYGINISELGSYNVKPEDILNQLRFFKAGARNLNLAAPCTTDDGIKIIPEDSYRELTEIFEKNASEGRASLFVPASGAATRMFKRIKSILSQDIPPNKSSLESFGNSSSDAAYTLRFMKNLEKFAFYKELSESLNASGKDINKLLETGDYASILNHMLSRNGLDFGEIPKGLIKFHDYGDYQRTAIEEHLVEASLYLPDKNNRLNIHFTISEQYNNHFLKLIEGAKSHLEKKGYIIDISTSMQKRSTDTIAVDKRIKVFRDNSGKLVFRPAGHGALLENLDDFGGEIIFIKNIDNVVPDSLKPEIVKFRKILGGYLIILQKTAHDYLQILVSHDLFDSYYSDIYNFITKELMIKLPAGFKNFSKLGKIKHFYKVLNRPIRVCGMVKNVGDPGGGPFWVKDITGHTTAQIVEASQVDRSSPSQVKKFNAATHFNPVDIVCGVKDFMGNHHDLKEFRDLHAGFITKKTHEGRELLAMELPGLWNGGMAWWNTVFVEVPYITFNPVKEINDLLKKEHQI